MSSERDGPFKSSAYDIRFANKLLVVLQIAIENVVCSELFFSSKNWHFKQFLKLRFIYLIKITYPNSKYGDFSVSLRLISSSDSEHDTPKNTAVFVPRISLGLIPASTMAS